MKGATFTFGSLCSGIEAASEAFLPLGAECRYVAEIEGFPCAYLAERHGAGRPRYMPRPEDADTPADVRKRAAAIRAMDRRDWPDRLLNLGDIAQVRADELPKVDIVAAGFPCQDFSIAGLRASLSGHRGSLSTLGVRLLLDAAALGLCRGAILEQVPDVLNTDDNAWGAIVGALVGADDALAGLEHGGKWPRAGMASGPRARAAWRILDAQHFGLAQRRERVWLVVDFGDGPDPAAVLFERKGVPGDIAAGGGAREGVAPNLAGGARKRGGFSYHDIPQVAGPQPRAAFGGNRTGGGVDVHTAPSACHTASGRQDFETETFIVSDEISPSLRAQSQSSHRLDAEAVVAHSLRAEGFDASKDGTGRGTPIVPVVTGTLGAGGKAAGSATSQDTASGLLAPVAYSIMPQNSNTDSKAREVDLASVLAVRRITVVEAEKLQGFPENATLIHWPSANRKGDDLAQTVAYLRAHGLSAEDAEVLAQTPDGPRYRALGNSWPVPVARWIGWRMLKSMADA